MCFFFLFCYSQEQFRYCYKTLWDFINLHLSGGTFTDTFQERKDDQPFYETSHSMSSDDGSGSGTTEI